MPYGLSPGLVFAVVDTRSIFLDLRRDRYFALPRDLDAAFTTLIDAAIGSDEVDPRLETLVRRGVLVHTGEATALTPACVRIAPDSALSLAAAPMSTADLLGALAAQAWAGLRLRGAKLDQVIAGLRRRKAKARPLAATDQVELTRRCAAAFVQSNLAYSPHDRCLLRALALCDYLTRRGGQVQLVFGVKLPFAAHCWVQSETLVLSDHWDVVADYTPILAV